MLKRSLKEIFELAEKNERKGVEIKYIWLDKCRECGSEFNVLDEEYCFNFNSKKSVKFDEIKKAFDSFNDDYGFYDQIYDEELELFHFFCYDKFNDKDIYFYFNESDDLFATCDICEKS